ncbi:MAG: glutamate synthase-related protein [Nitrospinota bacterium]
MGGQLTVNLEKISKFANVATVALFLFFFYAGNTLSFYFHFASVFFFLLGLINFYYRHIQKEHTLLSNFGFMAQGRYMIESVGPEFRQYLYSSDVEERPFNRNERAEVYRKAKDIDSSSAFGSQLNFSSTEIKLKHSLYPKEREEISGYELTFGHDSGCPVPFTVKMPFLISAMSYGALSEKAVRSLARGASKSNVLMNTGEGGFPKYHLMENCDLIFQIGTAKFGVRTPDGGLDAKKLEEIAKLPQIKMIELKLSQGAKPGKGGLLPKEKVTEEIALLRGIPMGKNVISPPFHKECSGPEATVDFISLLQDIARKPVGIKLCLGNEKEFTALVDEMVRKDRFPDYISIDGSEGGTGAAPKSFMDDIGVPLFFALQMVSALLNSRGIREKVRLLAAGKLINPSRQITAMGLGADAVYTARGFMLALGCIQALQCNRNTCPVGITTHQKNLQQGLDIEEKSQRVSNYVKNLYHDHMEILGSLGVRSHKEISKEHLWIPEKYETGGENEHKR